MSVQVGSTVYVAVMNSWNDLYVAECRVLELNNGEVRLESVQIHRANEQPTPSSEQFTVPEKHFDLSLDQHIDRLLEQVKWFKERFKFLGV